MILPIIYPDTIYYGQKGQKVTSWFVKLLNIKNKLKRAVAFIQGRVIALVRFYGYAKIISQIEAFDSYVTWKQSSAKYQERKVISIRKSPSKSVVSKKNPNFFQ